MKLLNPQSLANTIDNLNQALFFEGRIPAADTRRVAHWIASRQGLPGSYAGMFAPTAQDYAQGIRLFTGERISTRAATGHILGEEACRVLSLLDVPDKEVGEALARASQSMDKRLRASESETGNTGFF